MKTSEKTHSSVKHRPSSGGHQPPGEVVITLPDVYRMVTDLEERLERSEAAAEKLKAELAKVNRKNRQLEADIERRQDAVMSVIHRLAERIDGRGRVSKRYEDLGKKISQLVRGRVNSEMTYEELKDLLALTPYEMTMASKAALRADTELVVMGVKGSPKKRKIRYVPVNDKSGPKSHFGKTK